MRTELGLKGNDLMVYGIIYGFTQSDKQWFTGSRQYLADWVGCSVKTVQRILDKLTRQGLLNKRRATRNSALCNDYQTASSGQNVLNSKGVEDKMSTESRTNCPSSCGQNVHRVEDKMSHHNIDNNIDIYIEHTQEESVCDISSEFDLLWKMYPKKTNRKRAEEEFRKVRQSGTDFERIKNGAVRYISHVRANGTETRYIKNLASFLKNESWMDEYEEGFNSEYNRLNIEPSRLEELLYE